MNFTPCAIDGMVEIGLERRGDDRGWFARVFCRDAFADAGLPVEWAQMNMSHTGAAGSLRGLHFQRPPMSEGKLIRALAGAVLDVCLDLRRDSGTFGRWAAVTLRAEEGNAVYLPPGCAHGFQALTDGATLHYAHTRPYAPALEGGVNPCDPALGIDWPLPIAQMSDRDRALPNLSEVDPL